MTIFEDAKENGDQVIAILISSNLSGTYQCARLAAESCDFEDVFFVDSRTASQGEGILILGDSGVGKSETAIELLKRGHRLVADDAVEIRRIGDTLTGTAPELIRHYLEVRGIGVVDIQKLFGMSGVKSATQIDLVIQFERWQDEKFYDRLGLDEAHTQIMGVPIPLLTIPVSAGRNLAGIVELAVMNNRQKKYGINSAREFVEQIDSHIDHQAAQEKNR